MSSEFDLARALASAAPGGTINLPPGEYKGTYRVEKPVTICGAGPATVCWSPQGPVFRIAAGPVVIKNLSIEVTEDPNKTGVQIEPAGRVQFEQVRLRGKVDGLPADQAFDIPSRVDFGVLPVGRRTEQPLVITVPDQATLTCTCTGLTIEKKSRMGKQTRLQLIFEEDHLSPGMLIDGLLEVSCMGVTSYIRLTGEVQTFSNTVAGQQQRGEGTGAVDPFAGLGRDRKEEEEENAEKAGGGVRPETKPRTPASPTSPATPVSDSSPLAIQASVDSYLLRIQQAESLKAYEEARALFEEAVMKHPQHLPLRVEQARFFERRGDFAAACSEWEIIQKSQPDFPDIAQHLARGYQQTGRTDRVIQILEALLPKGNQPAEVYRLLAVAYQKAGRMGEANWALEKAQQISFDRTSERLLRSWKQQVPGG